MKTLKTAVTATATTAALIMLIAITTTPSDLKTILRRNDRGDILDWVVVSGGVVSLALLAINWVRPFVQRHLAEIV